MRTSSYTIYVDLPDHPEEVVLVHGYTGAYDLVTRDVADYVRSLEQGKPPKPLHGTWSPEPAATGAVHTPSAVTIEALVRRGYLTDRSLEEEYEFFTRLAQRMHKADTAPTWVFMPSYDCNLRCHYCYQDHMRTDAAFEHLLRRMDRSLVDRIFTAIVTLAESHGLPAHKACRAACVLYGGEPLLAENREIVEYIVERAIELGCPGFRVITNGTDLHHYEDLLGPGKLASLQITLDGPPDEHDRRRIYADGTGTWDRISRNIDLALARGAYISLRMNVDRNNLPLIPGLADAIIARGWHERDDFDAYAAAIVSQNDNVERATTMSSWQLKRELKTMQGRYPQVAVISPPAATIGGRLAAVLRGEAPPQSLMRATYCTAHTGEYIFDALGDVYACWDQTGDQSVRIAYIDENGRPVFPQAESAPPGPQRKLPVVADRPSGLETWRSRNVTTNEHCRKCRYALYCGGGCAWYAVLTKGEFHTNFCDGFQSTFRSYVAEAFAASKRERDAA
jgi:uncharacterized protein